MDEEFGSALLTGCVLLALDVGIYPARPAERFARRMPISLPQEASLAAHRLPTDERSSRAPGLSWSATRSSWPLPNHLPPRRPGPNRRLGWPSTPSPSFD